MAEFLNQTFEADTFTIVVVAILCGWAGALTLRFLSKTMLALVFVPGFIVGALLANYLFDQLGYYPTPERESNVVVACSLGIIAAFLVMLAATRLASMLARARVERHQFKRY